MNCRISFAFCNAAFPQVLLKKIKALFFICFIVEATASGFSFAYNDLYKTGSP